MRKYWREWLLVAALALALWYFTPSFLLLFNARSQKDFPPASRAAALRRLPTVSVQQLAEAITDKDPDVRLIAAQRLADSKSEAAERAKALVRGLQDDHLGVRREAAWSLSYIGSGTAPFVRSALQDDNPRVRAGACLAIGFSFDHKIEELENDKPWPIKEAIDLIPILQKLQKDADPEVQQNAEFALAWLNK